MCRNVPFPGLATGRQVLRCVLAIVPMRAALVVIPLRLNGIGLLASVLLGRLIYIARAVALDVGQVRSPGGYALRDRFRTKSLVLSD